MFWKQKRNPPRRFSICPILVDGTLRFTSSKFEGFRRNPRIGGFRAKCCRARGCQKLSRSTKYLPNTPSGTYNPNVYNCQDPFKGGFNSNTPVTVLEHGPDQKTFKKSRKTSKILSQLFKCDPSLAHSSAFLRVGKLLKQTRLDP